MTGPQIIDCLANAGAVPIYLNFVLDREYACPSADYIRNEFAPWFWQEQYRRGVATWKAETNDCDNFSLRAMCDMQVAHALASPNSRSGIAFGLFFYRVGGTSEGQPHAISCAIIRGADGQHRPMFFEPQPDASTFGEVALSQKEITSCIGYLFC